MKTTTLEQQLAQGYFIPTFENIGKLIQLIADKNGEVDETKTDISGSSQGRKNHQPHDCEA